MTLSRALRLVVASVTVLVLLVDGAEARGSNRNNRNTNNGGRYRLIEGEDDSKTRREEERKKKREEEQRKKEEAKKQKEEERKRAQEEKKQVAEAKKREAAEKAKEKAAPKAKAKGTPKAAAKKGDQQGEQEAAQLVEQAEAQFQEGELLPGVALLRQCLEDHGGTDAAKTADARLAQLLEHEKFGPMLLFGEAEELFGAQRYRKAWNKYTELLSRFPDSEQGAEASKRLAEIREGDLLSKTVYTDEELKDARFWLLVGNIHAENERRGEAKAAWQRVVEGFPGCPYAKQAEGQLTATRGS